MLKPNNYDNISAYGEVNPLELGGHICRIMKVEETKSSTGKEMIKIYLDIAAGPQMGYFAEKNKRDNRPEKKWGCIVYQLTLDSNGNANPGLKTFHTAVEHSNPGFSVIWGDEYAGNFTGKLVGGVFGREQYRKQNGELGFATKCAQFRSVEAIKNGVEVPKDKLLDGGGQFAPGNVMAGSAYTPDSDLPF